MRKTLLALMLSLLLAFVMQGAPVFQAQEDDEEPVSPALAKQLDKLSSRTSSLRNLPITSEVQREFPTREEAIDYLEEDIERQLAAEDVQASNQFYQAFGFVGPDFDLQSTFLELIGSQVAGFYDPRTDVMNVLRISGDGDLGDSLPVAERVIYVHEFVHALQDQHFDLAAIQEQVGNAEPDRALAMTALIEGDATLVMQEYMLQLSQQNPEALNDLMEMESTGAAEVPESVPSILENELLMPYLAGMGLVTRIRSEGGWESVNAAFDRPPVSTEQVLHPEKYIEGEAPIDVQVSADAGTLGDGWELLHRRTLGEFYLRQHIGTAIGSSQADDAGAGWGGDQYALYYNASARERAWVLKTVWDSTEEKDEFQSIYSTFASAWLDDDSAESGCWQNADAALCLSPVDNTTVTVAYAPEPFQARVLLDAQ